MSEAFYNCYSLISADLSNLETNSLVYMGSMFRNCFSLKSVDLSKINIRGVKNMDFVFCNCISLTSLNIYRIFMVQLLHGLNQCLMVVKI